MELLDAGTLAFLIFFGFISAFIDAVVGGGGLISIPALMNVLRLWELLRVL